MLLHRKGAARMIKTQWVVNDSGGWTLYISLMTERKLSVYHIQPELTLTYSPRKPLVSANLYPLVRPKALSPMNPKLPEASSLWAHRQRGS